MRFKSLTLFCIAGLLFNASLCAQSVESIKSSVDAINDSLSTSKLSDAQQVAVKEQVEHAQASLNEAAAAENQLLQYENTAENIDEKLTKLATETQNIKAESASSLKNQPLEQLDNKLMLLQAKQTNMLTQFDELQQQKTLLSRRPNAISDELNSTKNEIDLTVEALDKKPVGNDELDVQSHIVALQAKLLNLRSKVALLEREVATIPARQALVDAQVAHLKKQLEVGEIDIQQVQTQLEKQRTTGANLAIENAKRDVQQTEGSSVLNTIAKENLSLANNLQTIVLNTPQIDDNSLRLRQQQQNIKQSSQIVSQILATGQITDELGILLHRLRSGLPQESPLSNRLENINEEIVKHQLNLIVWQDNLRTINETKPYIALVSAKKSSALSTDINKLSQQEISTLGSLKTSQAVLLQQLIDAANNQLENLVDEKLMIVDVKNSTAELKALLDRRLVWLPSYTQLADNVLPYLMTSLQWYADSAAWAQVGHDLWQGINKNTLLSLVAVFLFALLLLLRPILKKSLGRLSMHIGNVGKDTHWATPLALFETIILALPLPLAIGAIAGLIRAGADDNVFSNAIVTALAAVSSLSLTLLFFRSMCRKNGIFVAHFAWSDKARAKLGELLTWFAWYQGLATFIFASAMASNQIELRYGIAIFAFITMSLGIAIFSFSFFKPKTGVAVNIVGHSPKSLLSQLAFPVMVIAPVLIGLMPLIGFFDTAVELLTKLFQSGVALIFVSIFYGIAMRVLMVAYRRYLLRKAKIRRAKQEAQRAQQEEKAASGEAVPELIPDSPSDNQEAERKMRKSAMGLSSLLFIAGLWFIWLPLLPALGIVNEIVLWQKDMTVDGIPSSEDVTLWNIIVSLLFLLGGFIAARNARGMLEISFFDKVSLDPGARYAAVTILGYVIMGTTLVLGLSQLGIDWSKLQWIVAALGVGLGFGLQEIVANFVSGLIILFERPVRVGDTVTIGDLSGTVSNIKIRATTITDFDNREVLLPNKSIITENVTNWTLHNPVTRLVVKIGIAYGSDTRAAKDLLLGVLEAHPDVLTNPAPSVFFTNHGESSLDFELRIFVDSPAKRLPVTHEINTLINEALSQNGFEIPFPQRDIHIIGASPNPLPEDKAVNTEPLDNKK
ncbi:MAG: mechanosensitive ion channel [Paraglaciecola sp.]|nr:mechanosensitive ion channel [Paraglaciecola sp.]